eukprot:6795914-Prymnesium_polylepis.2
MKATGAHWRCESATTWGSSVLGGRAGRRRLVLYLVSTAEPSSDRTPAASCKAVWSRSATNFSRCSVASSLL